MAASQSSTVTPSAVRLQQRDLLTISLLFLLAASAARGAGVEWTGDLAAAQKRAGEEHKFLFLFFTESDFCGDCARMKSAIFDQPEFEAFARANLVLAEVDLQTATCRAKTAHGCSNSIRL